MRILCRHGHFALYPQDAREVSRFANLFEESIVRVGDYYTFAFLKETPDYSIQGKNFLNLPATITYAGLPWEVMRENGFVYNVALKTLVPKASIVLPVELDVVENFWITENPLLQPGSRNPQGQQLLSYDAEYIGKTSQLRILEVQYV